MITGKAILDTDAIACQMLLRLAGRTKGLGCGFDGVIALAHGLGGEVGVHASAVPVALHGLGLNGNLHLVLLAYPIQQVASHPQVIANGDGVSRADLELPLTGHNLGVGSRNGKASLDAKRGVFLNQVTASNLHRTDAAVVRALRSREALRREAVGPARLGVEHGVFLLKAKPWLLAAVLVHRSAGRGPGVGGVRRKISG